MGDGVGSAGAVSLLSTSGFKSTGSSLSSGDGGAGLASGVVGDGEGDGDGEDRETATVGGTTGGGV